MSHLDENKESSAKIRTSIAYVLSKIISISAEESVGTYMYAFKIAILILMELTDRSIKILAYCKLGPRFYPQKYV